MAEPPVILQTREADEMPLAYCSGEIFAFYQKLGTCGAPGLCRWGVANNPEVFAVPGCQDLYICLGASLSAKTSNAAVNSYVLAQTGTHISDVAICEGLCTYPECAYAG